MARLLFLPALLLLFFQAPGYASGAKAALRRSQRGNPAASSPQLHPAGNVVVPVSQAALLKSQARSHSARLIHWATATKSEKANATEHSRRRTCQACANAEYTMDLNADDYDALTNSDGCSTASEDQNCMDHYSFLCDCYGTQVCRSMYTPDEKAKVMPGSYEFEDDSLHELMCDALDHMGMMNPNTDTSCHIYASMGDGHSDICS